MVKYKKISKLAYLRAQVDIDDYGSILANTQGRWMFSDGLFLLKEPAVFPLSLATKNILFR